MPRSNIKDRLRKIIKPIIVESVPEEESFVPNEFHQQTKEIMKTVTAFQEEVQARLGLLTREDSEVVLSDDIKDELVEQLWKCRKTQLINVRKQCVQLNHQLTYMMMMTRSIEEWMVDQEKDNKTIIGDYDIAMINADLGEAYQILFNTEKNLNHNYLSAPFTKWGVLNTTLGL